jgi:hypothetical protein
MRILKVIQANDPAITDVVCYCFTAKETKQLYEAMRHNQYIINCDVRLNEAAIEFPLMQRGLLDILTVVRNNLLRANHELHTENQFFKPIMEANGTNK